MPKWLDLVLGRWEVLGGAMNREAAELSYEKEYALRVRRVVAKMDEDPGTWPTPRLPSPIEKNEPTVSSDRCLVGAEIVWACRANGWRTVMDKATDIHRDSYPKRGG